MAHSFVFVPGRWVGNGVIVLPKVVHPLHFYVQWVVWPKQHGVIHCQQEIEVVETEEERCHEWIIADVTTSSFSVEFKDPILGSAKGEGVISESSISWKFSRKEDIFQGFEVYEQFSPTDYRFHAEYGVDSLYGSIIDGKVWLKTEE